MRQKVRLYKRGTYQRTDLLKEVIANERPLSPAILEGLFNEFLEGTKSAASELWPRLDEFCEWMTGTGSFQDCEPCEVIW